jgi:hypothetical protein
VLAEIVYPREHVLDGAAQARQLQVSSGRAGSDRVAAAPDVRLFPGALAFADASGSRSASLAGAMSCASIRIAM